MNKLEGDILEKTKTVTKEPPLYKVLFHNDDFTPKGFVVELLVTLFHKSFAEAAELMWRVHGGEKGVAGIYPHEIAEYKVAAGIALAREHGFPLKLTMEPDL